VLPQAYRSVYNSLVVINLWASYKGEHKEKEADSKVEVMVVLN